MKILSFCKEVFAFLKKYRLESGILLILGFIGESYFHAYTANLTAQSAVQNTLAIKYSLNHYIDHNDQDINHIYTMFLLINDKLSIINRRVGMLEGKQALLIDENNELIKRELKRGK